MKTPVIDMKPRCETCLYVQIANPTTGVCKRNPPTPYLEQSMEPITQKVIIQPRAHYPIVGMNDWCGEHNLFGVTKLIDKRLADLPTQVES